MESEQNKNISSTQEDAQQMENQNTGDKKVFLFN